MRQCSGKMRTEEVLIVVPQPKPEIRWRSTPALTTDCLETINQETKVAKTHEKLASEIAQSACRRYVEKMKRPIAASVAAGVYNAAFSRALRQLRAGRLETINHK